MTEKESFNAVWEKYGYKPPSEKWKYPGAQKYPPEKECFAYSNRGCSALKRTYCRSGKCDFYKTYQQYKTGLQIYGRLYEG